MASRVMSFQEDEAGTSWQLRDGEKSRHQRPGKRLPMSLPLQLQNHGSPCFNSVPNHPLRPSSFPRHSSHLLPFSLIQTRPTMSFQEMPAGTFIAGRALHLHSAYRFNSSIIGKCQECHRFFLQSPSLPGFHHSVPIVFTDGACLDNHLPQRRRRAGYGVVLGTDPEDQFSFSFNGLEERLNHKAELRGVQKGLELGMQAVMEECWYENPVDTFVVFTDSWYAVQGITEQMTNWHLVVSST